jgi:hypothetical protein
MYNVYENTHTTTTRVRSISLLFHVSITIGIDYDL